MKQQQEIKNPFMVPENYFEEVNRKILSSTSGSKEKRVFFVGKYRPFLSAAASIAGLILIGFIAMKLLSPADNYPELSEIMTGDMELYFNDIDLNLLEKTTGLSDIFEETPTVESEEIIDYLLFENIQISEIYEEL